jgi:mono/diheme cytochrome c family protein
MKSTKSIFLLKMNGNYRLFRLSTLLAVLFLFISFAYLQLADQKTALASSTDEAELFKSKCGKCHDPELALKDYHSAEVWQDTITRMREEHSADISQAEAEQLVKYHVERQKQETAVFKEKCEKCHPGKIFLEKSLSADQIRAIVKRMQHKAGNTIEESDIETIVKYHARSRQAVLEKNLDKLDMPRSDRPGTQKEMNLQGGMALFAEKCSECHELNKALAVFKDPEIWNQTIKRMQYYSKGAITDQQVEELVGFHVTEQQREIHAFKESCTKCHDDERISRRSMSEEEWLATIKRMQKKAPELIPDERINLLTAYFHRRELTMAKIFSGKCQLCHYANGAREPFQSSRGQLGGVIVMANEEFGDSLQIKDIESLVAFHVQRQDRSMQLYRKDCQTCHPGGLPKKQRRRRVKKDGRSRAEWISFIATLQSQELDKESQNTINSQIDYHISSY